MTMVLREPDGLQIQSLDDVERLARTAVASGLVAVRRAEEAVVLLLTGRELGLSPMQSLRGIYVVSGRPVLSADLMVAVIRRSGLCRSWRVLVSTAAECTIETQREGESESARKTWTADDARRAGLGGKGTWAQYPAQMLRHRVAADLAREVYPDVLLGLYTPDEVERPDTPAPVVVREEPEGSRAFAAFVASVEVADRVVVVHLAYRDLLAGLHEEGADAVEYIDRAGGAYALAAAAIRRRVSVSESEARAVLAAESPELARGLDAAADHADTIGRAADWWARLGDIFVAQHRPIVGRALARTVARIDATDAVATGKAVAALKAAVAALTPPEPPTGTDAPAARERVAANGDGAAREAHSEAMADRIAWAPVTTSDGVTIDDEDGARRHIGALNVWALRKSYRRHRDSAAWQALVIEQYSATVGVTSASARKTLDAEVARADREALDRETAKRVSKAA